MAVDPFSKWVELRPVVSLHLWRAAHFLYEDLVGRWGTPRYVWTDNGSEFAGSFDRLCAALGIVHLHITPGNSKANGQVERTIRTAKEVIRRGMTKYPQSYWSDHLTAALLLLRHTASRATGLPSITMLMARQPAVPPTLLPQLLMNPDKPTAEEEAQYYEAVSTQLDRLHCLGGQYMSAEESRLRELRRQIEGTEVHSASLFFSNKGDAVLRQYNPFTRLDARAKGPFVVVRVSGQYRQRVTIKPLTGSGRKVTVHMSTLTPYAEPYQEPQEFELGTPPADRRPTSPTAGCDAQRKKRKVGG